MVFVLDPQSVLLALLRHQFTPCKCAFLWRGKIAHDVAIFFPLNRHFLQLKAVITPARRSILGRKVINLGFVSLPISVCMLHPVELIHILPQSLSSAFQDILAVVLRVRLLGFQIFLLVNVEGLQPLHAAQLLVASLTRVICWKVPWWQTLRFQSVQMCLDCSGFFCQL